MLFDTTITYATPDGLTEAIMSSGPRNLVRSTVWRWAVNQLTLAPYVWDECDFHEIIDGLIADNDIATYWAAGDYLQDAPDDTIDGARATDDIDAWARATTEHWAAYDGDYVRADDLAQWARDEIARADAEVS